MTAEKRFDVFRHTESLLQIFGVDVADRWGRRTGFQGAYPCPIVLTIWLLSIAIFIEGILNIVKKDSVNGILKVLN